MINCEMCSVEIERQGNNHKYCEECGIKSLKEFNEEYHKEYRQRIEVKKRQKEYMEKYSKEWYKKNKEKLLKQQREYYHKNKVLKGFGKMNCKECKIEIERRGSSHKYCKICEERIAKEKKTKRKKEYRSRPEVKEREKIYSKKYEQRPEVKEMRRKRRQRPEVKDRERALNQRPEVKKRKKAYKQRSEVKEKRNKNARKRRKTDLDFKIRSYLTTRLNEVFKAYSTIGKQHTSKKYGINFTKIIEHLKPFPKDVSKYHIDHIIPLSKFDFNDLEQIKKAFAPKNHQWLTVKENLEKGDRLVMPHYNHKFDENGEEIKS